MHEKKLLLHEVHILEEKLDKKTENIYDVITLFQVIEHLRNPYEQLKKLTSYLKINGLLYIECPNDDGLYVKIKSCIYRMLGEKSIYNSIKMVEHIYGFNKNSVTVMVNRLGLRIVEIGDYYYNDGVHQVESDCWWPTLKMGIVEMDIKCIVPIFDKICSSLFSRGAGLYILAKKL